MTAASHGLRVSGRAAGARAGGVLGAGLLVILLLLVLVPLVVLVRTGLAPAGTLPFETARLTLDNFVQLFARPDTGILVRNTLVYATGTVAFAGTVGLVLAWLTERTDMPGRVAVRIVLLSWLAVPPLVIGFGWILLINPGNGALNVLARWLTDGAFSFELYSMSALIVITGLAQAPTAFVMIAGLMRNMDPQLENAARLSGAGGVAVARHVTLPLLKPGLVSITIFLFMSVVQTFDLPAIIGLTARIPVFSTRVYLLSSADMGIPNYGLSAALGVLLLVFAALLIQLYFRYQRQGERYQVVGGRAFRPGRVRLGPWRWLALGLVCVYLLVSIAPVLILGWTSLLPFYQAPSLAALDRLTLAGFARVLNEPLVLRGLTNTVILTLVSATAVMALGFVVAWHSVRTQGRLARLIDLLAFVPAAVPPIVVVIALLVLYIPTPLYGTIWLIVLAHVSVYVAFGARTMTGAVAQLHKELGDAALVSGAGTWTTLTRVVLPLVRSQILNGWLWVAAHSARDLTAPLMLMTSGSMVAASVVWIKWDLPDLPGASAVSVLLVAGLLAVVVPIQILTSRGMDE
ncbi:MAG: ABC transporter permease [Rhodospirillales bacterium]|jgi:iron(III) transport system permease protein